MKAFRFLNFKMYINLFILIFFFVAPTSVFAHKIHIFAYESNGNIICEAKFNNNNPIKGGVIEVFDGESQLLTGSTNEKGIFTFSTPNFDKPRNLKITINSGDGHKAEWLLLAEDYLIDSPEQTNPVEQIDSIKAISKDQLEDVDKLYILSTKQIHSLIQGEVNKRIAIQLAPIKRQLAEQKQSTGPTTKDILAGIGIIFGLMGLLAYFKSRKLK